jgi:type IV pilus assembly protein PilM
MRVSAGKNLVGVDIEPGYVAAVQTKAGQVAVERAAGVRLAPEVVRDGEVTDVEALSATLRELFAEHKLDRRVRLGVANQRIVVRTLELPPISDAKQLTSAIRFQAQDHIPMPLDQAVLEHHSLGLVETADGPRTRVVLVAARRDMIERLLEAVRRAGLRAQGIDLAAFAMVRALHRPNRSATTVYLSVGGLTNIAIASGKDVLFTRVIALGVEALAGELAERRGLTVEHAHGWLRHVGLQAPVEELEGQAEIVLDARHVVGDGVRRIADEVRTTLDFHRAQSGSDEVGAAIVTGPGATLPGLPERLGEELGVPVEVGVADEARPGAFGGIEGSRLAVAAGLTVAEVPA